MSKVSYTVCPFCGHEHELAAAIVETAKLPAVEPTLRPGNATMCARCGEFSVMDRNEMLRRPTHSEARKLARDYRARNLRQAWAEARARRQ
jgi:hypothetical protein